MSDEQNTQDSPQTVAPQQTPTPSPQQTPPQQPSPAPPQQSHGPGPGAQLLDAINALPERLVNALREQQPRQTAPSTEEKTEKSEVKPAAKTETTVTPGKKSFTEWWFGK